MAGKKQYGLIISHKKNVAINRPSVFGEDSSSDEEGSAKREFNSSIRREGIKKMQSKANREAIAEALAEDPTIYEYDSIYDQLQEQKKQSNPKLQGKKDTKSRYIANLKRTAELRKIEQELAYERRVQKELEAEGETFAEKDSFVTGAYKKKLQERAVMEQRLKEEEEREKLNDVTKEDDLGRMYKHLLNQKTSRPSVNYDIRKETEEPKGKEKDIIPADKRTDEISVNKLTEEERQDTGDMQQHKTLLSEQSMGDDNRKEEIVGINVEDSGAVGLVMDAGGNEVKESKEERRKRLFAKRTSDDAALSAKERYLARKRAKLSQPTIATEDD